MTRTSKIENAAYNLAVDLMEEHDEKHEDSPSRFNRLPHDDQRIMAEMLASMILINTRKVLENSNI